jgi:signal transduction histidine kinase
LVSPLLGATLRSSVSGGERIYVWLVLVATGLPAFFRLVIPKRYAELQAEKLRSERAQRNHRILGWITLAGSPLILLYGIFGQLRTWMWLATVVGVVSGADSLTALWFLRRNRFATHTFIFGGIGAVTAVLIWWFFLRH